MTKSTKTSPVGSPLGKPNLAYSAYAMKRTRVAYVIILGKIWMPPGLVASLRKDLSDYDLNNIGEEFTRENVEEWLTANAGDFQEVIDFSAVCGETEIPWSSEENESKYYDTISDPEE